MIKLLKLEYAKLRPAKYFKVLGILFLIAFFSIPIVFNVLVDKIESLDMAGNSPFLSPSNWPFFDFADIWQNLTYVYKMITMFLCLMLIISTTNEFDYKTARQNIINGLSKKRFWLGKISLILVTAAIASIMLLILGLIAGFIYSPVTDFEFIVKNIEFVGAYFLHLVHFLLFTLLVSLLIRRAGFTIAIVLFWTYIVEPILSGITSNYYELLANFFPMESGWNLIHQPFGKFALQETQDYISFQDLGFAMFWISIFLWGSYLLLAKRDI